MKSVRQRYTHCLIILLLALIPISCSQPSLPEMPAFEKLGFENALNVVKEQMVKYYDRVQEEPRNGERNGYFGMLLSAYDKNSAASIFFHRARILDPMEIRWAYYLATSFKQLGRYQEAADLYRESLTIEPDNIEARIQLASVLLETNEFDDSIKLYRAVTAQLPERIDGWLGLGRALDRSGDHESAITALKRAKNLGLQYGDVRYALAGALNATGDKEGAAREYAAYERKSRNTVRASDRYIAAVIRLNASDGPLLTKADYRISRGQFKEAVSFFRRALEINPNNQDAWGGLVYAQGRLGDSEETAKSYEAALAAGIQYKRLHFTYAEALRKWQKFEQARDVVARAIALDASYTKALLAMGELELQLGATDAAVKHYRRATIVVPNDRGVRFTFAKTLNAAKQFKEALSQLETLTDDPTVKHAQLLLEMAIAYRGLNRDDDALDALQRGKEAAVKAYDTKTATIIESMLAE